METKSPTKRPLGKDGPMVSRIGFGTMGIGFPCSRTAAPIPDAERLALLDQAYEVGCTFWDTSDFYVRPLIINTIPCRTIRRNAMSDKRYH